MLSCLLFALQAANFHAIYMFFAGKADGTSGVLPEVRGAGGRQARRSREVVDAALESDVIHAYVHVEQVTDIPLDD